MFSFDLGFKGKMKELYNPVKPPFYIPTQKEQDKSHKLHGTLHLF
jgi:hypothetical protein